MIHIIIKMSEMDKSLRLLDFNIYDEVVEKDTSSGSESGQYKIAM